MKYAKIFSAKLPLAQRVVLMVIAAYYDREGRWPCRKSLYDLPQFLLEQNNLLVEGLIVYTKESGVKIVWSQVSRFFSNKHGALEADLSPRNWSSATLMLSEAYLRACATPERLRPGLKASEKAILYSLARKAPVSTFLDYLQRYLKYYKPDLAAFQKWFANQQKQFKCTQCKKRGIHEHCEICGAIDHTTEKCSI